MLERSHIAWLAACGIVHFCMFIVPISVILFACRRLGLAGVESWLPLSGTAAHIAELWLVAEVMFYMWYRRRSVYAACSPCLLLLTD